MRTSTSLASKTPIIQVGQSGSYNFDTSAGREVFDLRGSIVIVQRMKEHYLHSICEDPHNRTLNTE